MCVNSLLEPLARARRFYPLLSTYFSAFLIRLDHIGLLIGLQSVLTLYKRARIQFLKGYVQLFLSIHYNGSPPSSRTLDLAAFIVQ